jgi:hypothetical protein
MDKKEKIKFINEIMRGAKRGMMHKVNNIPNDWDGFEIRQFIIDYITDNYRPTKLKNKRLKDYKNKMLITNQLSWSE